MIKIKTLLVLVFIFSASIMQAQQIEMVKRPLDTPEFYQNDKKYKMSELVKLMKSNYKAVEYMKKARTNNTFSQIFVFSGASLVGFPVGTSIGGGDPNWTLAMVGGGLMVLSVPFLTATNRNGKKAVEAYNAGFGNSESTAFIQTVTFSFTGNGVSLALQF